MVDTQSHLCGAERRGGFIRAAVVSVQDVSAGSRSACGVFLENRSSKLLTSPRVSPGSGRVLLIPLLVCISDLIGSER